MTTKVRAQTQADEYDLLTEMYPPKDGIPAPDGMHQEPHFHRISDFFRRFFRSRSDVLVTVDNFVYYEEGSPNVKLSPDIMVAFDVDIEDIMQVDSYLLWRVGKPPDFVLEVASKSTWRRDLREKRDIYEWMQVPEYCRLDPTGGDYYGEPLVIETLVDGRYQRAETRVRDDGVTMWRSRVMNLWLYQIGGLLYIYDPVEGRVLTTSFEEEDARIEAQAERDQAQSARDQAQIERDQARNARDQAQIKRNQSEFARDQAEVARDQAEFARNQAQIERDQAQAETEQAQIETEVERQARLRAESERDAETQARLRAESEIARLRRLLDPQQ